MDKIYTKTGDKGYTTNLLNKRYSKADMEMELQGEIDEINAYVGFLRSKIYSSSDRYKAEFDYINNILKDIQYHLYLIGVEISTEFTEIHVNEEEIFFLERNIDYMIENTKQMDSFIYYFGSEASSLSHIIRSIVRRAERVFVRAIENSQYPKCYQYINRLSDFFFAFSRFINYLDGFTDEPMTIR